MQPQRQVKQTEILSWTDYLGYWNWIWSYCGRMAHLPPMEGDIRYIGRSFEWYEIFKEPTTSYWNHSLWHAWSHKANWYRSGGLQLNPCIGWIISKPQRCYWWHQRTTQETRQKTVSLDSSWVDTHWYRGEDTALYANPKTHTRGNPEDQDQLDRAMQTRHSTVCCSTNWIIQDYEDPHWQWLVKLIQSPPRLYK